MEIVRMDKSVSDNLPIVVFQTGFRLDGVLGTVPPSAYYYSERDSFIAGPVVQTKQHCTIVYGIMPMAAESREAFYGAIDSFRTDLLSRGIDPSIGLRVDCAMAWDASPASIANGEERYKCVVLKLKATDSEADSFYMQMRRSIYSVFPVFNSFGFKAPEPHITVAYIYDPRDKGTNGTRHTDKAAAALVAALNAEFAGKPVPVVEVRVDDNEFKYYGRLPNGKR